VQKFTDSLESVYRKRGAEMPVKPNYRDGNTGTSDITATEIQITATEIPQRKKESKESKESKVKDAPTREGDIFDGRSFSEPMKAAITKWLKYKAERRDSYKPTGLTSLLTQIENKLKVHGEAEVIALIEECMASNWAGIIWDKIKGKAPPPPPPKVDDATLKKYAWSNQGGKPK
jgi:hypothetical protein